MESRQTVSCWGVFQYVMNPLLSFPFVLLWSLHILRLQPLVIAPELSLALVLDIKSKGLPWPSRVVAFSIGASPVPLLVLL